MLDFLIYWAQYVGTDYHQEQPMPEKFTVDEIRAMMLKASRAHPGDRERQRAHLDDQIRARFSDLAERKAAAGEARGLTSDDVSRMVRDIGRRVPLGSMDVRAPLTTRAHIDLTETDIELLVQLRDTDADDDEGSDTWALIDTNVFEVMSILRRLANNVETQP